MRCFTSRSHVGDRMRGTQRGKIRSWDQRYDFNRLVRDEIVGTGNRQKKRSKPFKLPSTRRRENEESKAQPPNLINFEVRQSGPVALADVSAAIVCNTVLDSNQSVQVSPSSNRRDLSLSKQMCAVGER
jgi:hypothetical protein